MPKRVIDFDAMWGSDKLASCAAWAQAEYAWLYGLADASGCFELTNLRVIWGRVAAIRENLTIERLEQVFAEFHDKGLMFVWEHEGKRYAHWTGSDVPGRLPAPSWRMRLERFAPPVPKQQLAQYMARFARGRAAMAGAGFSAAGRNESAGARETSAQMTDPRLLVAQGQEYFQRGNSRAAEQHEMRRGFAEAGSREAATAEESGVQDGAARHCRECAGEDGLKAGLEEAQAQDWNWNQNWNGNGDGNWRAESAREPNDWRQGAAGGGNLSQARGNSQTDFYDRKESSTANSKANSSGMENPNSNANPNANSDANASGALHPGNALRRAPGNRENAGQGYVREERFDPGALVRPVIDAYAERDAGRFSWRDRYHERELAVQRELRVGQGPSGPCGVSREALERIRKREEARAAAKGK